MVSGRYLCHSSIKGCTQRVQPLRGCSRRNVVLFLSPRTTQFPEKGAGGHPPVSPSRTHSHGGNLLCPRDSLAGNTGFIVWESLIRHGEASHLSSLEAGSTGSVVDCMRRSSGPLHCEERGLSGPRHTVDESYYGTHALKQEVVYYYQPQRAYIFISFFLSYQPLSPPIPVSRRLCSQCAQCIVHVSNNCCISDKCSSKNHIHGVPHSGHRHP